MTQELQNLPQGITPEALKELLENRSVLIELTKKSFFWFFYIYFGRYFTHPVAPFHLEMIKIAQDESIKRAVIMAFRGSAKSTILNTAFSLWCIMGLPQRKHIVIASQTQQRARDHLMNIRKEIENNKLLSENLGPFKEGEDRWHASTLIIPRYNARMTAISVEEGVRGLREGPYRPDIIICDDIEDSSSAKTMEGRDKTYNWLTGELFPLGDINTRVIILGNFLQEDSVLSRIEEKINKKEMDGVFIKIPIIDGEDNIAWPGKFPNLQAIDELRKSIGNEITWQRDYLLRAIPTDYQIIHPGWIQYYDKIPKRRGSFHNIVMGVDLAISQKETADYTAIVSALIFGSEGSFKVYILPNPVNRKMNFPETILQIKNSHDANKKIYSSVEILIEDVGYQRAVIDQLHNENYHAEGIKVSSDKISRLATISNLIKTGKILFPKQGAETLIKQLTGFGVERHDDLVDAFCIVGHKAIEKDKPGPRLTWIFLNND